MKITVDPNAIMEAAVAETLSNMKLDFSAQEIELTENPSEFIDTLRKLTNDYLAEFSHDVEMQFQLRVSKSASEELTSKGIYLKGSE